MHPVDHPVVRAVAGSIRDIDPVAGIVVGVSGGADSVALTHALQLAMRGRESRFVVAHLDHQLRPESAVDADWVSAFGASMKRTTVCEARDVAAFAGDHQFGIEEAARTCRYEFLSRVAAEQNCRYVAVAHTADDQAETVLHHLLRGTGLGGLQGMPSMRPLGDAILIRPLLQVSRADVVSFLDLIHQSYLSDPTNDDDSFTRNRIRNVLLPMLQEQFNPRIAEALSRLSEQARASQQIVDELAQSLIRTAVTLREADQIVLRVEPLCGVSRHLVRDVFRLLFAEQDWPRQRMGYDDWNRLADLAQTSQVPKSLTLPAEMSAHFRRGLVTLKRG